MLDTDIAGFVIRDRPESVRRRLATISPEDVCISAITLGELRYGVARGGSRVRDATIDLFVDHLVVLPWNEDVCATYGRVRAELDGDGNPIGALDTMIAAHAVHSGARLVTNDLRRFERVRGLLLENWA